MSNAMSLKAKIRKAAYIPTLKSGGFTPPLGKTFDQYVLKIQRTRTLFRAY